MAGLNRLWSSVGCVFNRPILAKLSPSCRVRNFTKSSANRNIDLGETYKPNKFHKKILVWAGTYKSVGEVPDRVSHSQLKRAMDLFRVRVNFSMVIATFIGCGIAIMLGRRLRDSGETLTAQGTRQREEWKRVGDQEQAAAAESPFKHLLGGAPNYSVDTASEFHAEMHEQLRVKDFQGPYVAAWGGFEPGHQSSCKYMKPDPPCSARPMQKPYRWKMDLV